MIRFGGRFVQRVKVLGAPWKKCPHTFFPRVGLDSDPGSEEISPGAQGQDLGTFLISLYTAVLLCDFHSYLRAFTFNSSLSTGRFTLVWNTLMYKL